VGVAREKGIPLDGVHVRVVHKQNVLNVGPADPRQREMKITGYRRHISVKGNLSAGQLEVLLWGANHCPVSNTLEGAVPIETKLELAHGD
jgi:uncharacterized OsmC-like protein